MQPPPPPAPEAAPEVSIAFTETEQPSTVQSGHIQQARDSVNEREAPQHDARVPKSACKCKFVQRASFLEHIGYFCSLSVFAYLGMLARVYLTEVVAWHGLPLFPAFYPELVGTTIMGVVISHKQLLKQRHKVTYDALATGFCGSITTFSSWNNDAVTVFLQYGKENPDNITRIVGWLTIIIIGFGMPVAALWFGMHLGYISPWADQRTGERVYVKPNGKVRAIEIVTYIVLWLLTTVTAVAVPLLIFKRYDFVFSFVLASLGAYLRWHLSPWNSDFKHFRPGTFTANTLGTWLLGAAYLLDHHYENEAGEKVKALLYGVIMGFCGCLTTVSTFAVELTQLSLPGAYLYGLVSVLAAQVGLVAIRGTYWWTR